MRWWPYSWVGGPWRALLILSTGVVIANGIRGLDPATDGTVVGLLVLITVAVTAALLLAPGSANVALGITAVGALLDWTVFPLLAAGLAWVLNSGSLAAMIVLADYLVVEIPLTSLPVPSLHKVAAWLPGMNIQLLAHGEINIAPDRPLWLAGLTLAVGVLLVLLGAVATARHRAVK